MFGEGKTIKAPVFSGGLSRVPPLRVPVCLGPWRGRSKGVLEQRAKETLSCGASQAWRGRSQEVSQPGLPQPGLSQRGLSGRTSSWKRLEEGLKDEAQTIKVPVFVERRRDFRVDTSFSLSNLLRLSCQHHGSRSMVISDTWGNVIGQYGAGQEASQLALLPGEDLVYFPRYVQEALFDQYPYIQRFEREEGIKIWPFRFARGVGYVICVMEGGGDISHLDAEYISLAFRRIWKEKEGRLLAT